jgi:hypothetical protein
MITTIDGRMSPNLETPKQKNYEQRQIKYKIWSINLKKWTKCETNRRKDR